MPKVVIVDAQGVRHAFPEGFDPEKAAAIVRGQSAPQAVDASEPDTYLGGALKGAKEGMIGGAKGFIKGVIPGAVGAVTGAIPALVNAGVATLKGGANLLQDPEGTLQSAWSAIKNIPNMTGDKASELLDLAATDPEAFGRMVGEMTGSTEVGIAALPGLKALPAGAGRVSGKVIEEVGKHGKWPIRMMGAHQLGSGNPLGLATMALPEALSKTGRAIRLASTPSGAVAGELPTRFLELEQDIKAGAPDVAGRLNTIQAELVEARKGAKVPEEVAVIQKQQNQLNKLQKLVAKAAPAEEAGVGSLSAEDVASLKKQNYSDEMIAKLGGVAPDKPAAPPVRVAPSAPKSAAPSAPPDLMDQFQASADAKAGQGFDWSEAGGRYEPNAGGSHVLVPEGSQAPAMSPIDEFLANNPMGEGRTVGRGVDTPGPSSLDALAERGPIRQSSQGIMHDMEEGYGHGPTPNRPPSVEVVEGVAAERPGELPAPGQTVGEIPPPIGMTEPGAPSMDTLMANRLEAAKNSIGIKPSRRAVEGPFSAGDLEALQDFMTQNPGADLAAAQEFIQQQRGLRSNAYRMNAIMDRVQP